MRVNKLDLKLDATDVHKKLFDQLGVKLGYTSMEDWYKVSVTDIRKHGGARTLQCYNDSPQMALYNIYPEHDWRSWEFTQVPRGYWGNAGNQRDFFDRPFKTLGYTCMDDWYNLTIDDIRKNGGSRLAFYYNSSPSAALQSVFPEHDWVLWKFKQVPRGYWEDTQNRKGFFDRLFKTLGYQTMEDWYKVTQEDIIKNGGIGVISTYYNSSPSLALQNIYPDHEWIMAKFKNVPQGYWEKDHRIFFDGIYKILGYKTMDDWYNTDPVFILKHGGSGLIQKYKNSTALALQKVYPEHTWVVWRFKHSNGPLEKRDWHKAFFDWSGGKLSIKSLNDWYKVSWEDIYTNGGLLSYPNNSPADAICAVYSAHNWSQSSFLLLEQNYWENLEHQRKFWEWIGNEVGVKCLEDWYSVNNHDIDRLAGHSANKYFNSLPKAMQTLYPQHNWLQWRFNTGYWNHVIKDPKKQRIVVEWLNNQLSIRSLDDWYRVSLEQVAKLVPIASSATLISMLKTMYPKHRWKSPLLGRMGIHIKASQREVAVAMKQLFPTHRTAYRFYLTLAEVEEEYKHPKMIHNSSGKPMELDLFIENLKLAIEYQGAQHYRPLYGMGSDLSSQKTRDSEKISACKQVKYYDHQQFTERNHFDRNSLLVG